MCAAQRPETQCGRTVASRESLENTNNNKTFGFGLRARTHRGNVETVKQYVVRRLHVEALFDFGERCAVQMQQCGAKQRRKVNEKNS